MDAFFSSLNFHHSSLIILKYPTRLAPSLTCHHSIFFTLFVNPILVTWSEQTVLLPAKGFHPHLFLFSHFSFPLQPCHSPKAQTQTHKNFSSSLTSSGPSPVKNEPSIWCVRRCDLLRHDPAVPTSIKNMTHFINSHGRSLPTKDGATSSLSVLSQLVYLSDLCVSPLGFEKAVRFRLELCLPLFFPIIWLVRK